MVPTDVIKTVFGVLLLVVLCLMNYNFYYLSGTEHREASPQTTPLLISRLLSEQNQTLSTSGYDGINNSAMHRANYEPTHWHNSNVKRESVERMEDNQFLRSGETSEDDVQLDPTTSYFPLESKQVLNSTIETLTDLIPTTQLQTPIPTYPLIKCSGTFNKSGGFIVALKIYEQQTMASGNLLQLQCVASCLNLAVVRPFMKDSMLLTPLDAAIHPTFLKMDDTFNMSDWNAYAREKEYSPLVDWSDFIQTAPRKVILVQIKYSSLNYVRAVRQKGLTYPHPPDGSGEYKQGCVFKILKKNEAEYLRRKGFKVVRKVCLNFKTGVQLSLKQFQEDIMGEYEANEVTVIINEWRGTGESQRVILQENLSCNKQQLYREQTKPSARLLNDAQQYIATYVYPDIHSTSEFLAVIARYEMTGLTRNVKGSEDDLHPIIPFCLQLTLENLDTLQQTTGLTKTFLSFDAGKYGSVSFAHKKYYGHLEDLESFVSKVYQGAMDIHGWEETFEKVSHSTDSGYIAMLQQVIVTKAKCILFVGGGTFQRHTLHLYKELHPNPADRCFSVIQRCTSPYRPVE